MIERTFRWNFNTEYDTWELIMDDDLVVYYLFRADEQGKLWGALDRICGAVPALASLRWKDVEACKAHVLEVAKERYTTRPLTPSDCYFYSFTPPMSEEDQAKADALFQLEQPKTFTEVFTKADREHSEGIMDRFW